MLCDASTNQQRQLASPIQSLAQTKMASTHGDGSKLRKLGVNLGGDPLSAAPVEERQVKKLSRTVLYPATSGTDHYSAPARFEANCQEGSPSKLCDSGVYVGEEAMTHAQDMALETDKMEESYNNGLSPVPCRLVSRVHGLGSRV